VRDRMALDVVGCELLDRHIKKVAVFKKLRFSCGERVRTGMNCVERVPELSSVINKLQCFQRLADGLDRILSPLRITVNICK
jgi:hypothetical protein